MHDEFDNFDNDGEELIDEKQYEECMDCPYSWRQLPFQPYGPPQQTPQRPPQGPSQYPGGYGRPQYGRPPGPPPSQVPFKSSQVSPMAVSPGSIRPCIYRYVYIWLDNGRSFWAWLIRVDRRTASGFRWNGRRWVYFGVDLRRIDDFECY